MLAVKIYAEGVAKDIKEYLPSEYKDCEVNVYQKQKNNGVVLTGICIRDDGQKIAPIIYVNDYYDKVRQGEDLNEIMQELADEIVRANSMEPPVPAVQFEDYDTVKEYLSVILVNAKANRDMLSYIPHQKIEDLALIARLEFPRPDGVASIKIDHSILRIWGIDEQELFDMAIQKAQEKNMPVLTPMSDMLMILSGYDSQPSNLLAEAQPQRNPSEMMFTLTNEEKINGAAVIAYPGLMKRVSELFPEGFYIIPSSIHETLILPKAGDYDPKYLGEIVREVNQTQVAREDVLSDRVYEYDKENDRIVQVPESVERRKEIIR